MNFEDLTPEQMQRAKELKTREELLDFVKEEGLELDDKELDAIAGGDWSYDCHSLHCGDDTCIKLNCGKHTCTSQFCPLNW
ncbi:MAG: hypothetical protein IJ092_14900 [Atopobiaceae bacterium]|nr:hypothetical protein [Atopobiaceae bacterium]